MTEIPGRSRSGVRIAGDEYQHIVSWNEVLNALRQDSPVIAVTVEAADAGNVDDIVVERRGAPAVFKQVKHAVDTATPVGAKWLTSSPRGRPSLLNRFYESWGRFQDRRQEAEMQLITDRETDPSDHLMRLLDRRTELLVPEIMSGDAATAKARAEWAAHLETEEGALLHMLAHLRFRTGRPYLAELERADGLMWGHGLATGRNAIDSALAFIRDWVQERWRRLGVEELRERVLQRMKQATDPGAVLVIEAIDDDLHPEDGTEYLRWVDRYEGDSPDLRRRLREAGDWQMVIRPELEAAGRRLRIAGHHRVLVRGAMRLPIWFAAGAALRHVHDFDVGGMQKGSIWSSDSASGTPILPDLVTHEVGSGSDMAIAIGVAADPSSAVSRFVRERALPVNVLGYLGFPGGTGPEAVPDGRTAARFAVGIRDGVRALLEEHRAERIHLFLAVPGALALLVGHRWNGLRPTLVYEHLGAGMGYEATLDIAA